MKIEFPEDLERLVQGKEVILDGIKYRLYRNEIQQLYSDTGYQKIATFYIEHEGGSKFRLQPSSSVFPALYFVSGFVDENFDYDSLWFKINE